MDIPLLAHTNVFETIEIPQPMNKYPEVVPRLDTPLLISSALLPNAIALHDEIKGLEYIVQPRIVYVVTVRAQLAKILADLWVQTMFVAYFVHVRKVLVVKGSRTELSDSITLNGWFLGEASRIMFKLLDAVA